MNVLSYISLYFLLDFLNKKTQFYFFLPLIFFSIALVYKILTQVDFVNKKALPNYSLYIMAFTLTLTFIILI